MEEEGLGAVAATALFLTIVVFTILGIMAQKHGERIGEARGERRAREAAERNRVCVRVRRLQRAFKEFMPEIRRAEHDEFKERYEALRSLRKRLEEPNEFNDTNQVESCLEEIREYFDELREDRGCPRKRSRIGSRICRARQLAASQ